MSKKPPILNLADIELEVHQHGKDFEAQLGAAGRQLGARNLGYRLVVVPPGKRAWPYHCHHANEEMFLILKGEGTLRYAGATYPIQAGDLINIQPGPDTPHQIINTSAADLHYLAVSTMVEPDVMEYPDSNKVVVFAGAAPGGDKLQRTFSLITKQDHATDYWDGELDHQDSVV